MPSDAAGPWSSVLAEVRHRRPDLTAAGVRAIGAATPTELAVLRSQFGPRLVEVRRRQGRRRRAREAMVFGST